MASNLITWEFHVLDSINSVIKIDCWLFECKTTLNECIKTKKNGKKKEKRPRNSWIKTSFKTLNYYTVIILNLIICFCDLGRAFWPVMIVATIASLIASRAMTAAIFSIIKQATALQCFPRLKIIHTSRKFMGQIYIPVINWLLLVSCLAFVFTFGSIYEIGNAYGILLQF